MRPALGYLLTLTLAACAPAVPSARFECTRPEHCATREGFTCSGGVCARASAPAPGLDDGGRADAGPPPDAAAPADAAAPEEDPPVDGGSLVDAGALDGGPVDASASDGGAPPFPADWWDIAFGTRWPITIDVGDLGEALSDFPVPVILTPEIVSYDRIASDGDDLRFVAGGEVLPHEIERWSEGGASVIWVRVPSLPAAGTTTFHLYANHPTAPAPPASLSREVWSSSFQAVYHLDGDTLDSSAGGFDATNHGTTSTTGAIGGGRLFDGASWFGLGPDVSILRDVAAATLSAFVRPDGLDVSGEQSLMGISIASQTDTSASRAAILIDGPTKKWEAGGRADDSEPWSGVLSDADPVEGRLVHIAARYRYATDEVEIFLEGQRLNTTGTIAFTRDRTSDLDARGVAFGAEDHGNGSYFIGLMDEVRVATTWRSDAWLRAEALAAQPGFVSVGPEETP